MRRVLAPCITALAALGLAACGGGGSGGGGGGGGIPGSPPGPPPSAVEAARLLSQASFGPNEASITQVQQRGLSGWIDNQFVVARPAVSHQAHIEARDAEVGGAQANQFYETWWRQSLYGDDQLRQRAAFALSQIFVISLTDPVVDVRGAASYYDMLERDAFGNFRTLLDDVTLHPMMGRYLTFLGNRKESATSTPDENYAREVMQLMTIGLIELNADGTPRLDGSGNQIPTYTSSDIQGLAKVFTGISWYSPTPTNNTFNGNNADPNRSVTPMIFYANFHSTSQKDFLGVTIPANAAADTSAEVRIALDRLFNHANTGPFISYRLIQQMVTSNPSAAYVGRVSAVFANNGSGVRGDMAAVFKAILMDPEARDASVASSASFGKLREPVIRLANWGRAFNVRSQTGNFLITSTSANTSLNQTPLTSPSVFNFWRPGFVPPGTTQLGQRNLVAPEFQVVDEVTAAGYINSIQDWINQGVGSTPPNGTGRDVRPVDLNGVFYPTEMALADNPQALVDRMNLLLFYGTMSPTLQARLLTAINGVTASNPITDTQRLNRAKTAVFFSMISPEYLTQR
jgi:uncharacterized protein (DUF1800 family)